MKWYEYVIARTMLKTLDQMSKEKIAEERWEHREFWRSRERKLDKGAWVYDSHEEINVFVPPRKNPHFVTIEDDEDSSTIILSKKPVSIESEQFDYPWDAEDYCERHASVVIDCGTDVLINRIAPISIADDDLCCPYCRNCRPPLNWVRNSFKQEMLDIPDYKVREVDTPRQYYWCPICNKQVEKTLVIRKNEEWKFGYMENPIPPAAISPFAKKMRKEKIALEKEERSLAEKERKLQEEVDNYEGCFPNGEVRDLPGGLIVRTLSRVTTKNGEVCKDKWIKVSELPPNSDQLTPDVATSYLHDKSFLLKYPKSERGSYLLRYCPISEIEICISYYRPNEAYITKLKEQYYAGKSLPIVETVMSSNETKPLRAIGGQESSVDVVWFAREVGLTHVPIIIKGWSTEEKEQLEDRLKDKVLILDIQKKLTTPLKYGQAYHKWNGKK